MTTNPNLRISAFGDCYSSPAVRSAWDVRNELMTAQFPPLGSFCDYGDCYRPAVITTEFANGDPQYLCERCVTR